MEILNVSSIHIGRLQQSGPIETTVHFVSEHHWNNKRHLTMHNFSSTLHVTEAWNLDFLTKIFNLRKTQKYN